MYNKRDLLQILNWFFKELLVFRKFDIVKVIFYDVLGIAFQTVGFATLMIYVHHLSNHSPIQLLCFEITGLDSISTIIVAGFSFFLLLGAGGLSMYKGRIITAKLARNYEEHTLCNIYRIYAQPDSKNSFDIDFYNNKKLFQVFAARAPNYLGRIYMEVMTSLVPSIAMLASLILMIYIEPILTLILIFVIGISLPFHIYFNKTAYNSSEGLKQHAKGYALSKASALDVIVDSSNSNHGTDNVLEQTLLSDSTKNFLNNYEIRLKITHATLMVTNLVGALMIFAIFIYLGYNVKFNSSYSLARLLFYLIPLRYFLGGLRSTFKLYTKFHTFLPYFKPYILICVSDPDDPSEEKRSNDDLRKKIEFFVEDFLTHVNRKIIIRREIPAFIISPENLSIIVVKGIANKLNRLSSQYSHKIKKFSLSDERISKEDVFRVINKDYSDLIDMSSKLNDYQQLSIKRLRQRVDNSEVISEKKFAKIWYSLASEIRLFISFRASTDKNGTCNFIGYKQIDSDINKIDWHLATPKKFLFIFISTNEIDFVRKLNSNAPTLVYLNQEFHYFNISDYKYHQKLTAVKQDCGKIKNKYLFEDDFENEILE